jgi:DNA invertase Pin-like site-specific DNA recombinase
MSRTNNRAAIYARISHDPDKKNGDRHDDEPQPPGKGGDGLGVARQEQDCRELAAHLHLKVTEVYVDNDLSAYSGKRRPGFEDMLDAMKNRQFDALICWHTDRLYRSLKDLERLIDIAELARVPIRTVQGGELDLSISAGWMVARILGSVARQNDCARSLPSCATARRSDGRGPALRGPWEIVTTVANMSIHHQNSTGNLR